MGSLALASPSLPSFQRYVCSPHLHSPTFFLNNWHGQAFNGVRWTLHPKKDERKMLQGTANTLPLLDRPSFSEEATAKLLVIVGNGAISPLGQVTWQHVMQHMVQRLRLVDSGFELIVFNDKDLIAEEPKEEAIHELLQTADMLVLVAVEDDSSVNWILRTSRSVPSVVSFDSSARLRTRLGGLELSPSEPLNKLRAALPGSQISQHLKVLRTIEQMWSRRSSDDVRYVLLLLVNHYVTPVKSLKSLRATGLDTLKCMVTKCGPQILSCLLDPNCRKALSCLTKCASTDQVCSYRCIASYESAKLEAFSLCILQKHNCLGLSAEIPLKPDVAPLKTFRGQSLTHQLAEDIFIGWLGKLQWSWRVAAGQNVAYDQFPCQFQLFYRGAAKGSMWYDPVFRVRTFDKGLVWRRRHYRVKRAADPGTFFFTVSDNGVVSREFWRIVDVADDLAWGLFFYSGAAAAAGQSYTGAILVTPNGLWPDNSQSERLSLALKKCCIEHWEMYRVNNTCCEDPPLDVPKDATFHAMSFWEVN